MGRSTNSQQGKLKNHDACRDIEKIFVKPRILVCAPSNAAVVNICEKVLKVGFKQTNNMPYRPGIIRLGAFDALISDDIKSILIQTNKTMIKSTLFFEKGVGREPFVGATSTRTCSMARR